MTVPVEAPQPTTRRTVVIRQHLWGWVRGWMWAALGSFGFLAPIERGFGLNAPATAQLFILPGALLVGWASWRLQAWMRPKRSAQALTVSPERLVYEEPGQPPTVVERSAVGLVEVRGDPGSGLYTVVVWDHASRQLGVWIPRWAGWQERHVVGLLRRAGYPAARRLDVYDGRFQAQTPGTPPQMVR